MSDDNKLATSDLDIIAEAKQYRDDCIAANQDNAKQGKDDLEFETGGAAQWDALDAQQRLASKRALITINKLSTFVHQVTNDMLQNTPSIKVHPVDNGADEETAEILNGMVKHIEYASDADVAINTAGISAVRMGYGYWRLITDYCNDTSFDQDIKFERITNPFSVHFDPASIKMDGSDQRRCLLENKLTKLELARLYPKSNSCGTNFTDGDWATKDDVIIGEYYRIESKPDTYVQLSNGQEGYKSEMKELPLGVTVLKTRKSFKSKTMLYKLTATEILEKTEIACRWIPVFPAYGNEINVDGKVHRSGIIRNAKDPARLYNYFWTSAAEEIKSRNNTPYIVAEGQLSGYEPQWKNAHRVSLPFLQYRPVTIGGSLAPPPHRQPPADYPNGMMNMAMHATDDIKATTGLFDSSLGMKGNATSGKQELAQQRQGDLANFHYSDNLSKSQRHCGRCIVDMIPHYYDTERVVRIMGDDGEVSLKTVNQQLPQPEVDEKTGAIKTVLNDLTVGTYDVTISTGPSYQTQRQEAAASMISMAQSYPQLMQFAGDKVVKSMDWPGADDIAERLKKSMPPELVAGEDGEEEEKPQLPPDVVQSMKQDHDMMQQLQQQLQQMSEELKSAKAANDVKIQVAEINATSALDTTELRGLIDLLKAQVAPPPQLVADVNADLAKDDAQS